MNSIKHRQEKCYWFFFFFCDWAVTQWVYKEYLFQKFKIDDEKNHLKLLKINHEKYSKLLQQIKDLFYM